MMPNMRIKVIPLVSLPSIFIEKYMTGLILTFGCLRFLSSPKNMFPAS
jgi:hypothetical protein